MKKSPVIQTKDVKKIYEVGDVKIKALNGVSIDIFKGDFLAIVGKSGSGKSTLMHLVGLLDTPTSGRVYLKGKDVSTYSEKDLAQERNKNIGFVFQQFNLLERTTSLENVMLPLQYSNYPRSKREEKAKEMLKLVGLEERIKNRSNELSGGQKQRVAIARALVNDPSIILADEPTGNLDSNTGKEIENLFKKLNKLGKTVVIVTHDEDLAKITKRKIIVSDGVVVK